MYSVFQEISILLPHSVYKYVHPVCLFGHLLPPWMFILLCDILPTRKETVCMCVEAYQGHTLSMLCAMPTVFIYCLTAYPSAKEQQFMCLIIRLTGHYSRGMIMTAGSVLLHCYSCCFRAQYAHFGGWEGQGGPRH